MPSQARVAEALEAWRDAERRRDALADGSSERTVADAEVAAVHAEYQRVFELQRRELEHSDTGKTAE